MPADAIPREEVAAIKDLEGLFRLLRDRLDWPVTPAAISDETDTFDWTPEELKLSESSARRFRDGGIRQVRYVAHSQPWGLFLVEFRDGHVYRTALRQVLRGLVPKKRGRDPNLPAWRNENLLFICTTSEHDRFTFGHFRGKHGERARLATFGWQREDTYVRTLCTENLPKLAWPEDDGQDEGAWLKCWAKAFDKEPLTKEFFRRFEDALKLVKEDLQKFQRMDSAEAYSRAQLLLERLIFLYFLQKRGWMNQAPGYLLGNFRPHADRPHEFTYYADFLERLFYALATAGPGGAYRLPGIPFLNGGLFDDDEFAPTPERKKNSPPLKVRNLTFQRVFDELLEAFNFTVTEDTPLDTDVAVDPEMLGKVFESIVLHAEKVDPSAPDKRKETGSFYTPRIVVHFICREAFHQYLMNHLPGDSWGERLKAVMDIDPADGLGPEQMDRLRALLSPADGAALAAVLKDLKCCDPAVGSGAFPVGLMHELVNLRRIADTAANGYVDPVRKEGTAWVHKTKEDIVENALYGVDVQQQAIEICRLRLWLSLVVDYDLGLDPLNADQQQFRKAIERISQLPNLEMNFRRGDSLHDHISGTPVLLEPGALGAHRKDFEKIRELGADLHRAKRAETKRKRRVEIMRRRLDLSERVLMIELERVRTHQADLPGLGAIQSPAEQERRIAEAMARVREALRKITADRAEVEQLAAQLDATMLRPDFYPKLRRLEGADFNSPLNFAWRLDFPAIFGREEPGFDIIVGNPPFVTARDKKKRELWRSRWPQVCYGKYHVLCPFMALSFGLLKDGGELGFIVSNAFAKREFGQPLVEEFLPSVDLQKVVDCSGLSFPGHTTPTCILLGTKCRTDQYRPIRVVVTLPGGGDLRTKPEESRLWRAIETEHDHGPVEPLDEAHRTRGFRLHHEDTMIAVGDCDRTRVLKHPCKWVFVEWPTVDMLPGRAPSPLGGFVEGRVGVCTMTNCDDVFPMTEDQARRLGISLKLLRVFQEGDSIRNWQLSSDWYVLTPYDDEAQPLAESALGSSLTYLRQYKTPLEERLSFDNKTFKELGRPWFSFERMNANKYATPQFIAFVEIATHGHSVFWEEPRVYKQTCQTVKLRSGSRHRDYHLLAGLLNSSAALFWLKQVCFNKGAGEDEHRDRFVFAGGKMEQLPVPAVIAQALNGKSNPLAGQLTELSGETWERGRILPSLALKKLFEKPGEAYYGWNSSLPGYKPTHAATADPFESPDDLRAAFRRVVEARERLRAEMVARQEEMDWMVYEAYGLIEKAPVLTDDADLSLDREERPFRLWEVAEGDSDAAVALVPRDWSEAKRAVWRERLALIRDNEHVRRIERAVYKRRWDEQWKVGNTWQCGPHAYDAELLDAFYWWLSEKAEWWLEHKAGGGPVLLADWTGSLWADARVQTAWQVAAEATCRLEAWKRTQQENPTGPEPEVDAGRKAFDRYFKALVRDQSVPDNIPWAVPWDDLAAKGVKVPGKVKRIRGKLNVPRERFWETAARLYRTVHVP